MNPIANTLITKITGPQQSTGYDLEDRLDSVLDEIEAEAASRDQVVESRLRDLEAEKERLVSVRTRVRAVK